MTYIADGKKNNNMIQCNDQSFMYGRDNATGAQIFRPNNYNIY